MVDRAEMKKHVEQIIGEVGVDNLSAKTVREKLETALGKEPGELKPEKTLISELIDEVMAQQEDAEEEEEEEEEEEAPPPKKAKKAPAKANGGGDDGGEKKEKTFSCTTVSGNEAPKDLKKAQSKKLKSKEFLEKGGRIEININGNKLTADPREFSSGGKGWYTGGKIEMRVNGKDIWAQAGINITIPGSQEWK